MFNKILEEIFQLNMGRNFFLIWNGREFLIKVLKTGRIFLNGEEFSD